MNKKLAAPVKQVALARIHVCGDFIFVHRRHKLSALFVDLSQQVMQFSGIFSLLKILNELRGLTKLSSFEIRQREIIPIVVRRTNLLRFFEQWHRVRNPSGLDVEFTQIVVSIVVARFQFKSLTKLPLRQLRFA